MKTKSVSILFAVMVVALMVFSSHQPAGAEPAGEVKLTAPMWGHEITIPPVGRQRSSQQTELLDVFLFVFHIRMNISRRKKGAPLVFIVQEIILIYKVGAIAIVPHVIRVVIW